MKILSLSNVILKKTMGNDQKPFYPAWLSNPNPDIPPIWLSYLTTSKHCNCVRHLAERSGAHISTSPLSNESVEPRKDITLKNDECDIASYADDNTPHTYDSDLYTVLSKLKNSADSLFTWFRENHMKPKGDNCHLLVTTEKSVSINIDGSNVENKKEKKLLDIKFDSSLSFKGCMH